MEFGIVSSGAYIPKHRLARSAIAAAHSWMAPALKAQAKGARAFCNFDEDSVTMAVEAVRDCLADGPERAGIEVLALASTTLPYADLSNAAIVAAAADLPKAIRTLESGGSQRAATSTLLQLLRGPACDTLLVASERPQARPASVQEMQSGAGAAALRLGCGDLVARFLGGASLAATLADHVRASDAEEGYFWEERWVRDEGYAKIAPRVIRAALEDAGIGIDDIDHFVMPSLLRQGAAVAARAVGFAGKMADDLAADGGHAGAAHGLLMLASVLESARPGERILLVGFGQGADALVFEATGRRPSSRGVSGALARRVETTDYLRLLSHYDRIELDWGMRAESPEKAALTNAWRAEGQLAAFKAGRCPACGAVQFPQLPCCVSPGCGTPRDRFAQASLADEPAKVLTYTADWLSYHPAPPLYVGFVQFENGARLYMETTDAAAEEMDVGVPVAMVFRIKRIDPRSGFRRYFWKATPQEP
ncbi:3-hydroxy-3-methylglutaryl CoA synthase [Tistlia consotensis]|uniref:3-hydroxy-3-methylglutaryl CoA synthase n=2 Tax=Tistlia TaxID=1321364 RepID=A0A1Y6CNV0_9PROT|nr:3-hydroxy-3-methylglutaryl CoA synthase [Tistlia consotensis USBA 355]SNS02902.1 3-hydroxy-3-methylglutaryl CoA synthase [Tistlia consotensis]